MVKAAYISADADVPVFGSRGCSVHVQEILRTMTKRGLRVDLFATAVGGTPSPDLSQVVLQSLPQRRAGDRAEQERAALRINASLREALRSQHAEQPYTLIYERYSLWSHAAMDFACEERIPAVLEVNAPLLDEHTARHLLIDRAAAEEATIRAFRSASLITTVSRQLACLIEKHPSARGKVHVVPNGADQRRFAQATPSIPRSPDEFVIGFVGELTPVQGLSVLLAAFQLVVDALPHSRLVIVGDGPEREPLERDAAARGLQDSVRFLGAVPPQAIPGMLASFDAAVAPYPALTSFYASPIKLFEYMAAGLPIVASQIGQVAEVLEHDRTGIMVQPGDREALAEALYNLAEAPEKRRELGLAAQARARSTHSWETALDSILATLKTGPARPASASTLKLPRFAPRMTMRPPAPVATVKR